MKHYFTNTFPLLVIAAILFISFDAPAQVPIISTVAGGVTYIGNGVPGDSARLLYPQGLAVDAMGNIYIADEGNNMVRKIDAATGIITTIAGTGYNAGTNSGGFSGDGGPAVDAELSDPSGVALDTAGNLYIADWGNNRVRMVNAQTGIITTIAGNGFDTVIAGITYGGYSGDGGHADSARLSGPNDVALDAAGNIYIADMMNNCIRKINASTGIITTIAGTGFGAPDGKGSYLGNGIQATSARLHQPAGIALDDSGNLYIADQLNYLIRKVTAATGVITDIAGAPNMGGYSGDGGPAVDAHLNQPAALTLDDSGNIYIADGANGRVRKISAATHDINTIAGSGTIGYTAGDGGPADSAVFAYPASVAIDTSGNIYIADENNNRIRKVAAITTIISTLAGGNIGEGEHADSAVLFYPSQCFIDASGNLYIADYSGNRIQRVDAATGIIHTIVGNGIAGFSGDGGPAYLAEVNTPDGVVVDDSGNVYFTDAQNNRIRKIDASTAFVHTIAGTGFDTIPNGDEYTGGYSGDGGPADSARLNFPSGLAIDTAGNLYFTDQGNNRVRKINTATGIINTVAGGGDVNPGDGGPADWAYVSVPTSVALDDTGNIYVAEWGYNRVRKVSAATGIITTFAGTGYGYGYDEGGFTGDGGPADSAELNGPIGVAVDAANNVYIADVWNERVRKVSNGIITTFAGDSITGFGGDGDPATAAELNYPDGVSVDLSGNVYICDASNQRIRKVTVNPTAIKNVPDNGGVWVYPNPTNGQLTVALSDGNYISLKVFNTLGQQVYSQPINTNGLYQNIQVNISGFSSGVYILQLSGAQGNVNKQIVLQK